MSESRLHDRDQAEIHLGEIRAILLVAIEKKFSVTIDVCGHHEREGDSRTGLAVERETGYTITIEIRKPS